MNKTKILYFDIETAPLEVLTWGIYEQNALTVNRDWFMMSFAAQWEGSKKIISYSLPDFKGYKKNTIDDTKLIEQLWLLLDEADVVVAHNGDKFDIRKSNARFILHDLAPPSPYRTIDTLKVARRYFRFDSNKLDDLAKYLKLGRKVHTGGIKLWLDCLDGDMKAWAKMVKYNRQDVVLLRDVYMRLRPWMTNHPNVNLVDEKENACPTCGSKKLQKRGFHYTRVGKFQKYQCQNCFSWPHSGKNLIKSLDIR